MIEVRGVHRAAGLVLAIFFFSSALTGITWAMSKHIYWAPDYMKPKREASGPPLSSVRLSIADALAIFGDGARAVTLRQDSGLLLYEVTGKKRTVIIDAITGRTLTPLSANDASRFASQYVKGADQHIASATLEPRWVSRRHDPPRAAYVIRYQRPASTEIVIDRDSGRILEESDPQRRVHFFITRLHQLDYFGSEKALTLIPGIGLLMMTATGLGIARRKQRLRRATEADSPADRAA